MKDQKRFAALALSAVMVFSMAGSVSAAQKVESKDDSAFEITKLDKETYLISGGKINRLAKVTDARNTEQVVRLQNILKSMGVFEELHKHGLKNGDTVILGHLELGYYDDEIWGEGSKV